MAVVKWQDFIDIQDRMNKLFEQRLSGSRGEEGLSSSTWSPAVDVYETPEAIVLKADLPGLSRSDVDIQVQDDRLILRGERRLTKEVGEESFLRIERAYGAFQRSFTLPASVAQERIRAVFRDGVLELTLPKAESSKPKRIPVEPA
ncbi:MAG TPA: Hsp20/alpha crystallin family protein [Candidatus Sulfotelmatobacter sp.]|nr:Hsp20/alpha crystallin family protein [Candidatus Sulfotelmatobacter sp.]